MLKEGKVAAAVAGRRPAEGNSPKPEKKEAEKMSSGRNPRRFPQFPQRCRFLPIRRNEH